MLKNKIKSNPLRVYGDEEFSRCYLELEHVSAFLHAGVDHALDAGALRFVHDSAHVQTLCTQVVGVGWVCRGAVERVRSACVEQ